MPLHNVLVPKFYDETSIYELFIYVYVALQDCGTLEGSPNSPCLREQT